MGIIVKRKDLSSCLKFFTGAIKGREIPDAVITCSGNSITFDFGGVTSGVSGEGSCDGISIMKGRLFKSLLKLMPKTEEIEIGIQGGKLVFGNFRVKVDQNLDHSPKRIQLPVNATKKDVLNLINQYSITELKESVYLPLYTQYEKEKNEKLFKAFELLEIYGVYYEDLENFVNKAIRKE